jgi:TRAP-type C4-dicarboxylate transport system permease small subunit
MLKVLHGLAEILARASDIVARLGVALVAAILFIQVVLRFVFNTGWSWPEEASRYIMIWVTMLAGSLLIRDEQLIAVDFFDKYWPASLIGYRNALFRLLLAIMLGVLCWYGLDQAMFSAYRQTSTLEISWFWPYLAVPVGAALMLLNMVLLAVRDLTAPPAERSALPHDMEPLG